MHNIRWDRLKKKLGRRKDFVESTWWHFSPCLSNRYKSNKVCGETFMKMVFFQENIFKLSSAKCRPLCRDLNVCCTHWTRTHRWSAFWILHIYVLKLMSKETLNANINADVQIYVFLQCLWDTLCIMKCQVKAVYVSNNSYRYKYIYICVCVCVYV